MRRTSGRRATTLMVVLLLTVGGLLAILSCSTISVEAANIPATINGDWTVTGTEEYDGGNCVLTGNLRVQNGGSLTLRNLTLAVDNGYDGEFSIDVENNGTLRIFGSTVKSNSNFPTMHILTDGILQIENSTVQDLGVMWWWEGVVVSMGTAVIKNSTFQNNDYGVVMWGGQLTLEDSVFKNNIEGAINIQTGSPTIRNVTVTGSNGFDAAVYVSWGASIKLLDSRITNNNNMGIMAAEASVEILNSTIKNNQNADIQVESWGGGMTCEAHVTNSDFGLVSIDPWGMGSCKLYVYWFANLSGTWESDGGPVSDGDFEVLDKDGVSVLDGDLGANGQRRYLQVKEYEQGSSGKTVKTPHTFNITGDRAGKVRTGASTVTVNKNLKDDIGIVLDDVPPALSITEPVEGVGTNQTYITLSGQTDAGSKVFVNDIGTDVDTGGAFVTYVDLTKEGTNKIKVRANDAVGNEAKAEVNVTRDTVVPTLEVLEPAASSLFNHSDIKVSGRTEAGANVSVNDAFVEVDGDGRFNTTLVLEQGKHTISVISRDWVGNKVKVDVAVEVDLTAPVLTIMEPVPDFRTKEVSVKLMGVTEPKATVTVNGKPVTLSGSMFQAQVNLVEGDNTITVRSCDTAHNCAVRTVSGQRDSTPPPLTVTNPPTNDEVLTNQEEMVLTGSTEPTAEVQVDGSTVVVAANGSFTKSVFLKEGPNSITIKAMDTFGNSVQLTRKVRRDTVPPELDVTWPTDGHMTKETQVEVKGTVEQGASVSINGVNVPTMSGTFSKILELSVEGWNNLTVVATDAAGNSDTAVLKVLRDTKVLLEVEGPLDGTETKNGTVTVHGLTDPGATVKVNNETVTAGNSGRFSVTLELEIGDNTIVVTATDELENSAQKTLTVTRKKVIEPNGPGTPGSGGIGDMLWLIVLVLVIVVVVAMIAVMRMRKKGPAVQEAAPQEGQAPVQGQPPVQNAWGQADPQDGYDGTQYQQPPPRNY